MVWSVLTLAACSPGGVELSQSEIHFEVPQEGDALQRATVVADNLFSYPVRIANTSNGPGQLPVDIGAGVAAICPCQTLTTR